MFVINSSGQPVVANTLIESAVQNALTADIATGLSTCITKDGQTTVTANIPLSGFKLTGVGAATALTDAATLLSIQNGVGVYVATVGGTANAITLTPSPAITAYVAGQVFWFKAASANTGATTVAISGLSTIAVQERGAACVGGEIIANNWYRLHLDTTSTCQLQAIVSGPPFLDTNALVRGSSDGTKQFRIEVDGFTTGNTRVLTPPDANLTIPAVTTKGDVLAASSSGVLARVAAGANGLYLAADSNQTAGVQYRAVGYPQDFRLSLTTAVPVTTADVTAAGTLYCVPYIGNSISLYDGTSWNIRTSAEFNLSLTLTSGKPYDIWCYDNSGTATLEVLVWTNDTTRATALAYQNGILVKSGDATRRYLGTLYSSGSNTTEDSIAKRYLWNYYHRVPRFMKVIEATNTWTYTTATFRQANAATANQLDYVQGVSEDPLFAEVMVSALNGGATASAQMAVGVGVDSTTTNSATLFPKITNASTAHTLISAKYYGYPGVGRHTLVWLEYSTASNTTTWAGDDGAGTITQSGIQGVVMG